MDWPDTISNMKELPYYKSIVKYILRKQLQQLLEDMTAEVGEESLIMTVNPQNGTISHHGSPSGKAFLLSREDLKTQFFTFCIANTSQSGSLNQAPETRKRRTSASDKVRPAKRKRTSSKTSESATCASETSRSNVRTALSKRSPFEENSHKLTSKLNIPSTAASDPDISNNTPVTQTVSENQPINGSFPLQVASSSTELDSIATNDRYNESEGPGIGAVNQIEGNHPYSEDKEKQSETECSNKDSLTNSHHGFNMSDNQASMQDGIAIKQEVKPEAYDLESNSGSDLMGKVNSSESDQNKVLEDDINAPNDVKETVESTDGSDRIVKVNSSDSARHNMLKEDCYAPSDVKETVESSDTNIQPLGTDIDHRLPQLQPIMRLEMCHPFEKQVTTLPDITNTFQNNTESLTSISKTQGESVNKLSKESIMSPDGFNTTETLKNSSQVTPLLDEIESDTIKIEPLTDFDNPSGDTCMQNVSSSIEPLKDSDNPVGNSLEKHASTSEPLIDFESTTRDSCKNHVSNTKLISDNEATSIESHQKDVSNVRKSLRKRKVSAKLLQREDDKNDDDDYDDGDEAGQVDRNDIEWSINNSGNMDPCVVDYGAKRQIPYSFKGDVLRAKELNPHLSQQKLAKMFGIGKTTIGEILKNGNFIRSQAEKYGECASKRSAKKSAISEALWKWFSEARSNGINVTKHILQRKAVEIAREMGDEKFKAGENWMNFWRKKYNAMDLTNAAVTKDNKTISK